MTYNSKILQISPDLSLSPLFIILFISNFQKRLEYYDYEAAGFPDIETEDEKWWEELI